MEAEKAPKEGWEVKQDAPPRKQICDQRHAVGTAWGAEIFLQRPQGVKLFKEVLLEDWQGNPATPRDSRKFMLLMAIVVIGLSLSRCFSR